MTQVNRNGCIYLWMYLILSFLALIQGQIFCPLHRDVHILPVLDIIVKNIPEVEEIDFSSNQISHMNDFEALKECSHLKILNMENNKVIINQHIELTLCNQNFLTPDKNCGELKFYQKPPYH